MTPLVEAVDLTVEFGGQRALDRVSFSLEAGEIVGLLGPNGAGKSTLGRVLVGEIPFGNFRGEIKLRGKDVRFSNSGEAHEAGVALVHQEGAAVDQLSIGENVMLTIEPTRHRVINWPALHNRAADGLLQLGVVADTHSAPGEHGGVALMELVEIARSIVRGGSVFVFDESTAALGADEVRTLLTRMRELAAKGASVIFISHRIDEVLAVCDRVVVLRDGRKVLDAPRRGQDRGSVIRAMLGSRLGTLQSTATADPPRSAARSSKPRPKAFAVQNWRVRKSELNRIAVGPINFEVGQGEVLGVFGPLGAGKTELLHSIYGLSRGCSGECGLDGEWLEPFQGPVAAIFRGMALVPAERQKEGIAAAVFRGRVRSSDTTRPGGYASGSL
jgi:ABC-type sugar transport system ATPase subunit